MKGTCASILSWATAFVLGGTFLASPTYSLEPKNGNTDIRSRVQESYGKLPLSFEVNQGQTDPAVKFLSRGPGYGLFLTQNEAVLALSRMTNAKEDQIAASLVRMQLVGAKPKLNIIGLDPLQGKSHYFTGNDPAKWHTDIAQYGKVKYQSVYPGIDVVYYGNQRQLEYDFVVAPGADPKTIRLAFRGVKTITIDKDGQLVLNAEGGTLIQHKPIVYQEVNGERKLLDGRYVLNGKKQIGFQVAKYDRSKPLVIDPVLAYSTYFGGSACGGPTQGCSYLGDAGFAIAVDSAGSAYVTGRTYGLPPVVGGFDGECGGPIVQPWSSYGTWGGLCVNMYFISGDGGGSLSYVSDAFVTKLNPDGTLSYSTYLGGQGIDVGTGIAVNGDGFAYVTGWTGSANFPITANAYDTVLNNTEGFVTKLAPDGTLQPASAQLAYSTFLGGSATDYAYAIAVDAAGQAYITGQTSSVDFPVANAAQSVIGGGYDAFVAKLNTAGTGLVYSTFLGGSGTDNGSAIALSVAGDGSVNAYVTGGTASIDFSTSPGGYDTVANGGTDAFITRVSVDGTVFDYSTYFGGTGNDYGYGIDLDSLASGWNVYVAGATASTDFPTTTGSFTGAFVSKLDLDAGSQLVYSTNPGGSSGNAIAVTSAGNAYVAGANGNDAFVTQLDAAGTSQVYTFPLGSSGVDAAYGVAVDGSGSAYVTGLTAGTDFPTTPGAAQSSFGGGPTDIFVSKIADASAVKFSASAYSVNEADGTVTISVERIGSLDGAISVDYSTADDSGANAAQQPSDYTQTAGTIPFADQEGGSKTFTVPIIDNTLVESSETFTVTLSNPVGNVYLNAPGSAVVTIADNDPGVGFSAAAYTVGEGMVATITVNRTGTTAGAITVDYGTSDGSAAAGSDYTATSGTIGFADGDNAPKTFTVPILDDSEGEPYQTVTLTLSNPTGGAVIGPIGTATLTIVDNDDSLQPNISAVAATNIATYSAKIIWTTDQPANSQVEYGPGYGIITPLDPTLVTSHSVTLTGLSANTNYPFRVKSRNAAGQLNISDSSNGQTSFTTIDALPPTVNSVSPSSVVHGVTVSQSITISGTNFVLGATITVGGLSGTTVSGSVASATTPFVFVNAYTVRFWWPNTSLEPASYTVTVTNPVSAGSYSASLTDGFTVTAPQPTVTSTSISPTYGISASQSVTISGANFVLGARITVGSLTGVTVSGSVASATTPFVYASSSTLRFWWPNTSLAAGSYTVQVVNPTTAGGLGANLANGFTVVAPQPTVTSTSESPAYGVTPSKSITIYGTNFVLGATITVGSLSGTTVSGSTASATTPFVFTSSGQVKFWWPNTSLAAGSYTVTVTNPAPAGGLGASLANGFTVVAPQPTVTSTSISPVYGISGSQSITISGSNFVLGATITVGSLSGTTVSGSTASATTPFVLTSSTQVKFWWPNTSLAAGSYTVTVTNPAPAGGLGASLVNGFTVVAPQPTVTSTSISPAYGISPSQSITISGSNFVLGATITVGSLSGTTVSGSTASATTPFVFTSSTQVKFWWPNTSLAAGSYTVTVTNPAPAGGLGASLTNGFTVVAPQPTVTSVSLSPVTYGSTSSRSITISGSNFVVGSTITVQSPLGTLTGVTVSGSTATASVPYVRSSSTQVKFWWNNTSLPVDSYDVTVTNPAAAGGLSATLADGFVVQ